MPKVVNPKLVKLAHPLPCTRCRRAAERALLANSPKARPEPICRFCLKGVETR